VVQVGDTAKLEPLRPGAEIRPQTDNDTDIFFENSCCVVQAIVGVHPVLKYVHNS
jgi:hypothetical protein